MFHKCAELPQRSWKHYSLIPWILKQPYTERQKVELILCSFLSHPTPLFIENVGLPNYQNTLMNSREIPKWKDQNTLKVHSIYQNAIGLLAKLPKYPWVLDKLSKYPFEVGMGFSIFVFFGLF
jgi:hypothetical protein